MDRKSRLELEREAETSKIGSLNKIISRLENSADKIAEKVKRSEVVSGVAAATSFVSTYLLASTDDFNVLVEKNGIDVFKTPEGIVMGAIAATGLLVAGGAMLYNHFQNNKLDDKLDQIDERYEQLSESEENLSYVNGELADIEKGEAFIKNWREQTKDFDNTQASETQDITPEE